jgi:hypothetical protein
MTGHMQLPFWSPILKLTAKSAMVLESKGTTFLMVALEMEIKRDV